MGQTDLIKQITNRQAVFGLLAIFVLAFSTLASSMVSGLALSSYSIVPTTSSVDADALSVAYTVEFTPEETASAFVVDFCTNSPLIGQGCDAPAGMNVAGADSASGSTAVVEATSTVNKLVVTEGLVADQVKTVVFENITNPTSTGVVYARIVTFASTALAEAYQSNIPGTWRDTGSVSMYFNESITVSGTVLEALTFCVAAVALEPACANAEDDLASLVLGDRQGTSEPAVYALTTGKVHEKSLFTQINTNASSGAVVRLRSSAPCGGLLRAGTATPTVCDIAPAPVAGFTGSDAALFGVKLGSLTSSVATDAVGAVGVLKPATGSSYDATAFKINYASGGATGVTSTLGDPFLDTNGAPATDQNMELIFGATVTNSTPAGTYSTDLSMIAVGKF